MTPRTLAAVFAVASVMAGCVGGSPSPSGSPLPSGSPPPSAAPSSSASPSPSGGAPSGFYLRAWTTQALPPASTFAGGALLTIADGLLIDDNVAIPMIFPGPLLVLPRTRPISVAGEQTVIGELHDLALLDGGTDFTGGGVLPGGQTGHLLVIADGTRFELTGDPARLKMCNDRPCPVDPASPEAFAAFWWLLTNTDTWLGGNLGQLNPYQPDRLAVLVVHPTTDNSGMQRGNAAWPLADFASFGQPFAGQQDARCAVVSGADLGRLMPALQAANQLTLFSDGAGVQKSLSVRALVPLEDSPCGA